MPRHPERIPSSAQPGDGLQFEDPAKAEIGKMELHREGSKQLPLSAPHTVRSRNFLPKNGCIRISQEIC